MAGEVDEAGGGGDGAKGALLRRRGLAHEGDHAAVVVRVALRIEQRHPRRGGDHAADLVDDLGPAALGEVGHTLDERHDGSLSE